MKKEKFNELLESVRQGAAILKGKTKSSRTFTLNKSDIKAIREKYKLSQQKFSQLLGISTATLQNWEQGRTTPDGPAKVLLRIADKYPEVLPDVIGWS